MSRILSQFPYSLQPSANLLIAIPVKTIFSPHRLLQCNFDKCILMHVVHCQLLNGICIISKAGTCVMQWNTK